MQNIYIARTKDNALYCFYHAHESGINLRKYENNKWGQSVNIVPDARENYTVSIGKNSVFYIFWSDVNGNINLCTNDSDNNIWSSKIIISNQSQNVNTIIFNALLTTNGIRLIYNTPSLEDHTHIIMVQQLYDNGEWGSPIKLDRIIPLNNNIFITQQTNPEHLLLFCQAKTPETNLGYREITSSQISDFNSFHTTTYQVIDTSFLTASNSIHVVYVVRTLFSTQLMYRKRDSSGMSRTVTILEAPRIENCSIFIIKNILYITFMCRGVFHVVKSEDNGESFSQPTLYNDKFCKLPVKAFYISENPLSEANYFMREVYIDKQNPFQIQIFPELIDDFYPTNPSYLQDVSPKTRASQDGAYELSDVYDPFAKSGEFAVPNSASDGATSSQINSAPVSKKAQSDHEVYDPFASSLNSFSYPSAKANQNAHDSMASLENSLSSALKRISDNDKKLSDLNKLIATKNKELVIIEKKYLESQKNLEKQVEKLEDQVSKDTIINAASIKKSPDSNDSQT